LNKKTLINLIQITNPVGQIFEELGGVFIKQYNSSTTSRDKILLFSSQPIYWINIVYNHNLKEINCTNEKLNMNMNFKTIKQLIDFEFNMFNINDYHRDYVCPKNIELEYLFEVFNILLKKTYDDMEFNTFAYNIMIGDKEIKIPLVRRIFIG
jgi:hypothetical protein